jgi:magnesium chelatase family protein
MGVEAFTITVEVDVTPGISFYLVGLPDSAVRESQQRIGTALQTIGCRIPGKKIVINMAPADIKKEGSAFDLAIAIGIVSASEQYTFCGLDKFIIMGELALDGSLRPVPGALPIADHARQCGFEACIFPEASAKEAIETGGIEIFAASDLEDVISILLRDGKKFPINNSIRQEEPMRESNCNFDFSDIKGLTGAKRAAEVAASGGHNLLMCGPPGSGKSMLAKAIPSILPLMEREEAIETSKIYSVAGLGLRNGLIRERPFRAPHHSASIYAITGGGMNSKPGEISLAHNGILFLDEIAEYPRHIIEVLRQPLEDRFITVSRSRYKITYPASFLLVATLNPCKCGYYGVEGKVCTCTAYQINRYLSKLSGPLLDRIDIRVEVNSIDSATLGADDLPESSIVVRERVTMARIVQRERFNKDVNSGINTNSQMSVRQIRKHCTLSTPGRTLLNHAANKLKLSARAYTRILKVARTIADMEGEELISTAHIAEAVQYRSP